MKRFCLLLLCGTIALVATTNSVYAISTFKKEFEAKYNIKKPKTDAEKKLAAAIKEVKCNLCHEGKSKKNHNIYGKALKKLLDKDNFKASRRKAEPEKVKKEIWDALDKVAAEKSGKDKDSPTFGELIKKGELPGGEPEKK